MTTPGTSYAVAGRHVLVTGGAGFIGSHLVDALLARGAARVTILDSMKYANDTHAGRGEARVSVLKHDLGHDPHERLDEALRGVDLLFHLAAEKHNQSLPSPQHLLASNIDGTYALFDAAGRVGVKKLVFTSSLYAYGRLAGEPMVETEVPRPHTLYGISKLTGEHLAAHVGRKHGLPHVALRYFFVYGPRQFPGMGYKSVIVSNFERLRRGERPTIFGDGQQALDYVYVDDVVNATMAAMESPLDGELLNVGSSQPTSINELTRLMIEVSGKNLEPVNAEADWTAGSSRVGANEKIRRLLKWAPLVSLREGLSRTYQWLDRDR
jgi:UDP-glucose 4-epimerase